MAAGIRLATVNNVLVAAIVAVNAFLILTPLLPPLLFRATQHSADSSAELMQKLAVPPSALASPKAAVANQLIIPAMQYDQPIIEGKTIRALHYGPWREPIGSTPDAGGNTVIAGHRFTYTNPRGTFYYLNKLRVGDEVGIIWNNKTYRYNVSKTEVVPPSDTAVETPTATAQVTLYTCTPLWLPKDRLVVVATLETAS